MSTLLMFHRVLRSATTIMARSDFEHEGLLCKLLPNLSTP
jgi:hypothetical protein